MKLSDVAFRDDLYPREKHSVTTVQQYADDLDVLPPIEVNQHGDLIDGRHRMLAFLKNEREDIPAIVTETASDGELLELAIQRNNKHGLQLSLSDKRDMARKVYNGTNEADRKEKKKSLAAMLSVSQRTISDWLSRIDKDSKTKRNKRIATLWQACHTQQEIADLVGVERDVVQDFLSNMENGESAKNHQTPQAFTPPLYNIWKQQKKSAGSNHFGNSESSFVENLLYLYTQPGRIVVDPFAGGGSTIDVCKKWGRRYWVADRKPIVEREDEIRLHDITEALPDLRGRWSDVDLVYLDPPYWKQAEGQYSNDASDLANMTLDDFHLTMVKTIKGFLSKLSDGSHVAMILQPTQWKSENREYIDHILAITQSIKTPVSMRIQAPYESQQCNAQMVDWAKESKTCLVLSREIVVWTKQ